MFDDGLLDDPSALRRYDQRLRFLAESGARVRREALAASEVMGEVLSNSTGQEPRAVIAAGPDSRLLRAVLEPICPVPFVAWPTSGLPGWAGSLDVVVVLAPDGNDRAAAASAAEAARRGCQLIAAAPAASVVAEHVTGRYSTLVPTSSGDQTAIAVVVLDALTRLGLGPQTDPEYVARALDDVAISCSPQRDIATNPAKALALTLADSSPVLWGSSPLAARAARRIAESLRAVTGRSAIAGVSAQLMPMLSAAAPKDVFADPEIDGQADSRPALVLLNDGRDDAESLREERQLIETAEGRGVRVERISSDVDGDLPRYAAMMLTGTYVATYIQVGHSG